MTLRQARIRLQAEVAQHKSQKAVAAKIGCSRAMLSRVLSGEKTFGLRYAVPCQEHFKIPASAWTVKRAA